eukprot:gene11237-biopygen18384
MTDQLSSLRERHNVRMLNCGLAFGNSNRYSQNSPVRGTFRPPLSRGVVTRQRAHAERGLTRHDVRRKPPYGVQRKPPYTVKCLMQSFWRKRVNAFWSVDAVVN